jgi:hypothetical protein
MPRINNSNERTPLWLQEVETSSTANRYVVIPESNKDNPVDPYTAPHLLKWLVLNSVLFHIQMGATPVMLIPMGKAFGMNSFSLGKIVIIGCCIRSCVAVLIFKCSAKK